MNGSEEPGFKSTMCCLIGTGCFEPLIIQGCILPAGCSWTAALSPPAQFRALLPHFRWSHAFTRAVPQTLRQCFRKVEELKKVVTKEGGAGFDEAPFKARRVDVPTGRRVENQTLDLFCFWGSGQDSLLVG